VPPLAIADKVTFPPLQVDGLFWLPMVNAGVANPSGRPVGSVMEVIHVPVGKVFEVTVWLLLIVNGGVPRNV
jgi:ribosomal 30S subunit maturation factor RimM